LFSSPLREYKIELVGFLVCSHPRTLDRGTGSAAGPNARRCDAVIAALFQGAATQQTAGLPRPNPLTGGVLGWEQFMSIWDEDLWVVIRKNKNQKTPKILVFFQVCDIGRQTPDIRATRRKP